MHLPDFPWDSLAQASQRARAHPDGIIDLSVGTPLDPTPDVVRRALCATANAPGYPQAWGTADLREAVSAWFARRRGVLGVDPDGVLPTVGSKELVAWLPTVLGLGAGDVVVHPEVAYPTYDVGARIAGATPVPADATTQLGPAPVRLVWVNSPANPTGRVLGADHLAKVVEWARARGAVVASDECYAELDWRPRDGVAAVAGRPPAGGAATLDGRPPHHGAVKTRHGAVKTHHGAVKNGPSTVPSILDPRVCGGSHEGLLAVYSLSKQSSMAGYRAAFIAGDPALVQRILAVRRHTGMLMPWPVQRAMLAALGDDDHVVAQRERYRRRRQVLLEALKSGGFTIDHSDAGLYLWATRGEPAADTVAAMAECGVLVAPGTFYGPAGARHVRVALTATDDRIAQVSSRWARLTERN
ncbi:MAG: aminotransferase class I/II-fold pyridoxal phosphate-dependent enzyme [Angustibacter sp.]